MNLKNLLLTAICLLVLSTGVWGQKLDSTKLENIQRLFQGSIHAPVDQLYRSVLKIESRPQAYLIHIADERTSVLNTRLTALSLLANFSDDDTGRYLEKYIKDRQSFKILRVFAVNSYSQAYARKRPERALSFLRRFQNDSNRSVRERIRTVVKNFSKL